MLPPPLRSLTMRSLNVGVVDNAVVIDVADDGNLSSGQIVIGLKFIPVCAGSEHG